MHAGSTDASDAKGDRSGEPFRVSFVIPLYDKAPFIERAIRSALAQTHPAHEIIVVDDGSRDDGPRIVERLAADAPSVRIVRQANAGPSAARNRGIAEARGDWIAFLDADDVVLPHHLERSDAMARSHPAAGVLGSAYLETLDGEHNRAISELAAAPDQGSGVLQPFYSRWIRSPLFFTSSVVVRRRELLALGEAFPRGEKLGEDLDVWFRLAERTCVAFTPSIGALYTVGLSSSLTGDRPLTGPLPAFKRLALRCQAPGFPARERRGALRLVATHWLNVARARVMAGDSAGALALIHAPEARHRRLYRLRTLTVALLNHGRATPLRLGRL